MTTIEDIRIRKILDSRGNQTVEVEVLTEHGFGSCAAPSGASTGKYEVMSYPKNDIDFAINNCDMLFDKIIGHDAHYQSEIDALLHEIDGTNNFSRIGGNIQFAYERLQIKGEFVIGEEEVPGASKNEHEGLYLQFLGEATEKVYGVARYGYWKPKGGDRVTRITIGLGYDLIENVSLRGEYQINDETPSVDNNLFSMQAVLNF